MLLLSPLLTDHYLLTYPFITVFLCCCYCAATDAALAQSGSMRQTLVPAAPWCPQSRGGRGDGEVCATDAAAAAAAIIVVEGRGFPGLQHGCMACME